MNEFALLEKQYYLLRHNAMKHCQLTIKDNANFRATLLAICKAKLCISSLTKILAKATELEKNPAYTEQAKQFKANMSAELAKRQQDLIKHQSEIRELRRQAVIQCRQYSLPE